VLRIGIEDLSVDPGDRTLATTLVRVELPLPVVALRSPRGEPASNGTPRPEPAADRGAAVTSSRTTRQRLDVETIEEPLAREALHFVNDLIAADERRVRREVGLPFFGILADGEEPWQMLASEQALFNDRTQWLQEHTTELLRRPALQLLRRLPLVEAVELAFEDFRSDKPLLSEPCQQTEAERRSLGRFSLRLHVDDMADPVEVAYIRSGLRLGSSQDFGRASLAFGLSPLIQLELHGRTTYGTSEHDLRADLSFRPTAFTSFHVAAGDDMDFLSTSSIYSLFDSPMDGAPGLVLYAVHIF
jgi:hypothetical protein